MSFVSYLAFRLITFPLTFFPYKWLHALGNRLGLIVYHCYPKYRKRALSNLALASDLELSPEAIVRLAKASLQNLMITALEYPKLAREGEIHQLATCENPKTAEEILKTGKGVIFFCGHQANWEILFLEGTSRMPGVAIGRPIKNSDLYRWVITIREKFGGKIIPPSNALKEGLRALKSGKFLGIVGDQGMPDSGFSSLFLGRRAWTSPLPALLSLRTGCPIIVATTRRENGHYFIHYSDPIWPTPEKEPDAIMRTILAIFEKSIKERPSEWLWTHNRWKQQLPGKVKKTFRQDAICLIFPDDPTIIESFSSIRKIYPTEFLTAFVPEKTTIKLPLDIEVKRYRTIDDILVPDYRFKLILNFTQDKRVEPHFRQLSALTVQHLNNFDHLCQASGFTSTPP